MPELQSSDEVAREVRRAMGFPTWRVRLLVALVVIGILAAFFYVSSRQASSFRVATAQSPVCRTGYARARTARDTIAVDLTPIDPDVDPGMVTCGGERRLLEAEGRNDSTRSR